MLCCVIGGNGFIGRHLVRALARQGKAVVVIDKNPAPSEVLPTGVRYICGDYGDKHFLREALKDVTQVIDLAYASVPKTSFEHPVDDILSNLPSAVNLFEVVSALPVKKVVIVSSGGTVYGKAASLPINEDHPTNPISPYGITKLAIEKYARMYHALQGLPIVCVRPANAFGEGQRPFVDQGFIATAVASVLTKKEITIFGDQGTIRDFVYVTDVAQGIIAALEYGRAGECYNVGTGVGTSNLEIVDMIASLAQITDVRSRIRFLPARPYDVPANVLNSAKLQREAGWVPAISLAKGLELTWKYFQGSSVTKTS